MKLKLCIIMMLLLLAACGTPKETQDVLTGVSGGEEEIKFSRDEGYILNIDYFSNTYISGDYNEGEYVLGYFNVEDSQTFYGDVFGYFDGVKIKPVDMVYGDLPSGLSQFKLINPEDVNPSYQACFDDASYTVYFVEINREQDSVYAAELSENSYFGLKEMIGEIRLSAKDFNLISEISVYDLLHAPMLTSAFSIMGGVNYACVNEEQQTLDADIEKVNDLLSLIAVNERTPDIISSVVSHMEITDSDNKKVGRIFFDTENLLMYIYPETDEQDGKPMSGTYKITEGTAQKAEELLEYLKTCGAK